MSTNKMYTAIIESSGAITARNLSLSRDKNSAYIEVARQMPDSKLLALVPGCHANWTHLFSSHEEKDAQRKVKNSNTKDIDVWSVPNDQ